MQHTAYELFQAIVVVPTMSFSPSTLSLVFQPVFFVGTVWTHMNLQCNENMEKPLARAYGVAVSGIILGYYLYNSEFYCSLNSKELS